MKLGGQAKTREEMWIVFGFGALGGRDADAGTGAERELTGVHWLSMIYYSLNLILQTLGR